jgi:hypothetical protein
LAAKSLACASFCCSACSACVVRKNMQVMGQFVSFWPVASQE